MGAGANQNQKMSGGVLSGLEFKFAEFAVANLYIINTQKDIGRVMQVAFYIY